MATTYWIGAALPIAQVDSLTITVAAAGGTVTATIGTAPVTQAITYTMTGADTTSTAAAALQALLAAAASGMFTEINWTVSANVITATANSAGTPFSLAASAGGGAAMARAAVTANSSPSDVAAAANWIRAGVAAIPQAGDDVVLQNTSVPLLWNLTTFAAVGFLSFARWQSFTGSVGLPDTNVNGYVEYRPKYFQFIGSAAQLNVVLGLPDIGSGPTLERYDVLAQRTNFAIQGAGSASENYNIYLLGTNANNTLRLLGTTCAVAADPAEVSTLASVGVDGGGTLILGVGVTFSGILTLNNCSATISCAPASVLAQNGTNLSVLATGLTYPIVTAQNGSPISWLSNSTITALTLQTGSNFDKSGDPRTMTITDSTIDGDSCSIIDPLSTITYTNASMVKGQVTSGPFQTGPNRTWKLT